MSKETKRIKDSFEWRDRIEGDTHNKGYCDSYDTEKIGVIGDQVVCRIKSRLRKGSTWMKEYNAIEVYTENKGGSSSRCIKQFSCNIIDVQLFCEKYLFGALNQRERCSSCGRLSTGTKPGEHDKPLCYSCTEWIRRKNHINDPLVAIIKGVWYTVNIREGGPKSCKGFSGSLFEIAYFDDRPNRITTNLWQGGECPEHLKSEFPDNAKFTRVVTR